MSVLENITVKVIINLFFMEDNMKKVLMFMLSALAVFSFAGCADDSSNANGGGQTNLQ